MNNQKPYLEALFQVHFLPDGVAVRPIDWQIYELLVGRCAECSIPLNTDDADYCMIAMITSVDPDVPAFGEMLALQELMPGIVADFKMYFKAPSDDGDYLPF